MSKLVIEIATKREAKKVESLIKKHDLTDSLYKRDEKSWENRIDYPEDCFGYLRERLEEIATTANARAEFWTL